MESALDKRPTQKDYLEDTYRFESTAAVVDIKPDEKDEKILKVLLDRTIFHPQGGGQPSDEGTIATAGSKFIVSELVFDRDTEQLWHKGKFEDAQFSVGETVNLKINEDKRKLHARLHSAGHLIDIAVARLALKWEPGKGYHFPDGAYVEYAGTIPADRPDLKNELQAVIEQVLKDTTEEDASKVQVWTYEEAGKYMEVPSYLPAGKPIRYVKLSSEDKGCPCGGTHVKHLKEIGKVTIDKIQKKGKNLRVSYSVA